MSVTPKTDTVIQRIMIPAEPAKVYEAFVDAKKHTAFTGSKATGKPRIGAKFTAWDGYIYGKFLELEEGKKLVQEWITTDWAEGYGPSRLELSFKAVKGGTEIGMIQSNVPAEMVEELKEGWEEFYWKPLKEYFGKHKKSTKTSKPST